MASRRWQWVCIRREAAGLSGLPLPASVVIACLRIAVRVTLSHCSHWSGFAARGRRAAAALRRAGIGRLASAADARCLCPAGVCRGGAAWPRSRPGRDRRLTPSLAPSGAGRSASRRTCRGRNRWCGRLPRIFFQLVPEDKRAKSRVHLDLSTTDAAAEVKRLCALGATVQAASEDWITMQDPDGNEFCVMRPCAGASLRPHRRLRHPRDMIDFN
ncbi:VOC family protein [Streptomyces sp. NPDC051554]|uniref:VOC family protein n=1 Tax=Streptomyces sp. NPDC051554 TaxID=3365656 RepID=UPI003789C1B4